MFSYIETIYSPFEALTYLFPIAMLGYHLEQLQNVVFDNLHELVVRMIGRVMKAQSQDACFHTYFILISLPGLLPNPARAAAVRPARLP